MYENMESAELRTEESRTEESSEDRRVENRKVTNHRNRTIFLGKMAIAKILMFPTKGIVIGF